jgi:hypothetical protein
MIFEALGHIPEETTRDWAKIFRETKQFITFESCKKNLHKVFGIKNDFFAKMFFSYLIDRKDLNTKVNLWQFTERLMPFWHPSKIYLAAKHGTVPEKLDEYKVKKERLREQNCIVFDMMNLSGDKAFSILDLSEMSAQFDKETPLGSEVEHMKNCYIERNLKVRFQRNKLAYDRTMFLETYPRPSLQRELENILCN